MPYQGQKVTLEDFQFNLIKAESSAFVYNLT